MGKFDFVSGLPESTGVLFNPNLVEDKNLVYGINEDAKNVLGESAWPDTQSISVDKLNGTAGDSSQERESGRSEADKNLEMYDPNKRRSDPETYIYGKDTYLYDRDQKQMWKRYPDGTMTLVPRDEADRIREESGGAQQQPTPSAEYVPEPGKAREGLSDGTRAGIGSVAGNVVTDITKERLKQRFPRLGKGWTSVIGNIAGGVAGGIVTESLPEDKKK